MAPFSLLGSSAVMPAGLFYDPRALNVSMTRAQSLLVVVGDPHCFAMDPNLKQVLQAALDHRTFFSLSGACLPQGMGPGAALGLRCGAPRLAGRRRKERGRERERERERESESESPRTEREREKGGGGKQTCS